MPEAGARAALAPAWTVAPAQLALLRQRYPDFAELAPVLPLQKGMLFHAQLGQQAANYNAFTRLQFTGALDSGRLRQALQAVAEPLPAAGRLVRHGDRRRGGVPAAAPGRRQALAWPWQGTIYRP